MVEVYVLLERADLLLSQGRYKDAESNIKKALEQEPENDYALGLLGRCFLNSGRYNDGIDVIRKAIAIDPNDSFYYYLLGFAYYHKNEHHQAIENLNHAIRLDPYNAEYFGLLAHVLIEEREFEQALDKANEGLELNAENITCLNARSIALNKLKRTEEAIATMQNALAQDPDNEVTHATIGWNLLEKGKHKDAQKHFLEAMRIDPNQAYAKAGLKESLKSKLPPYRWLLQYSFWVQNKTRKTAFAIPILIYIAFRVLVALSSGLGAIAGVIIGVLIVGYLLFVFTSWTVNSIANFFLLFHRIGKYALTVSEKWAAISTVTSIVTGLLILGIYALIPFTDRTGYDNFFAPGIICISLALPLGNIHYPVNPRGRNWREWYGVLLAALGIISILIYAVAPGITDIFVFYLMALIVYNWIGVIRY